MTLQRSPSPSTCWMRDICTPSARSRARNHHHPRRRHRVRCVLPRALRRSGGTQSLYTGGTLTANVDAARANKEAALFSYQQTVLQSFAEVEDALSSQMAEEIRYQALTAQ